MGKAEWVASPPSAQALVERLIARCRRKPVAVLLDAALAAAGLDASGRLAARDALDRLGYIWCPPGQLPPVVWSAGIPSLTQYVLDQAAPAAYRRDSAESGAVAQTRNF